MHTSPIDNLITHLENEFKTSPSLENTIKFELDKLVRNVYTNAINQKNGWCMSFKIPGPSVLNLLEKVNLTTQHVKQSFVNGWQVPADAFMVGNPYYHTLLMFIIYGLRNNKKDIIKSSIILILCKIWNGRRMVHIPYCNADVMRYVIANLSGKYLMKNFDDPISLIINHYAVTLIEKYGANIKRDSYKSKRLFDQCFARIRQLFVSDMAPDIKTGKPRARSGIAPLYFEAKDKGYKISTPKTTSTLGKDDSDVSSMEYYTSHDHEEMIMNIQNHIIMNIHPKYDRKFVNYVNTTTSVNITSIQTILQTMHSIKYDDYIHDILELLFKQLQSVDRMEICSPSFLVGTIRKKVISSKHSPNITQLKNIIDLLLERIFEEKIQYKDYATYSTPSKGKLRSVIIYGIAYNIQQYICTPK